MHMDFPLPYTHWDTEQTFLLFGSKLGFSRIWDSLYDAFWQCSRVCYKPIYNSTESEPIWMKSGALWVHCLGLALTYFGRVPRSSDCCSAQQIFCQISNARFSVSSVSQNLNNTLIGVAMKTFGTEFWKFYHKGSFFPKKCKNFLNIFNVLWLQAAITSLWLQVAWNSLPK